jgi:hypothetical protein
MDMRFPLRRPGDGRRGNQAARGPGEFCQEVQKKLMAGPMFLIATLRQNPPSQTGTSDLAGQPPPPNCLAKAAAREGILKNNRIDYMIK